MARVRALVDGRWHPELYPGDPALARLRAAPTTYREWVTPDGRPASAAQPGGASGGGPLRG